MARTRNLRRKLVGEIEKLSEEQLNTALNCIQSLLKQDQKKELLSDMKAPHKDPLLEYIGTLSHGSLASNIDKELYSQ